MVRALLPFISTLVSVFKLRRELALENLALRQQLTVYLFVIVFSYILVLPMCHLHIYFELGG